MTEPDFLSQVAMTDDWDVDDQRAWMKARITEAKDRGATWHRMSVDPDRALLLHEAWKKRPKDEGKPRWQLTLS